MLLLNVVLQYRILFRVFEAWKFATIQLINGSYLSGEDQKSQQKKNGKVASKHASQGTKEK